MKLIYISKLTYWTVQIAIANQKLSKAIAPTQLNSSTLINLAITMQLIYYVVPFNPPCIFHITTPSTKCFMLAYLHCSHSWSVHGSAVMVIDIWLHKKLWCILIVWHQKHLVLFLIIPTSIFITTSGPLWSAHTLG